MILHSLEYDQTSSINFKAYFKFPCDTIGKSASIAITDANSDHANRVGIGE